MKRRTTIIILLVASVTLGRSTFASQLVGFGSGTNQFSIDFLPIGDPNNPPDTTGDPNSVGSVLYEYRISKFEISTDMIEKAITLGNLLISHGQTGPDTPANSVNWYEAALFANWLNTSTGHQAAYNFDDNLNLLLWSSEEAWQMGGENRFRHKDAFYFLPSTDEWYKAAYYDPVTDSYFNYPTGTDSPPDGIDFAGDPSFDAVFDDGHDQFGFNDVDNAGILSPFGTMGQGGNVWELEETAADLTNDDPDETRGLRGGSWSSDFSDLAASNRQGTGPSIQGNFLGFRIASIVPEPGTLLLAAWGMIGLLLWRRR